MLFLPFDPEHAFFLKKRTTFNYKNYTTLHIFTIETKLLLQKLFLGLILLENKFERWRQKFKYIVNFDQIYEGLKRGKKEDVSYDDYLRYLDFHRINSKNIGIISLYKLLDRKGIGKISKEKFIYELSPKSKDIYYDESSEIIN